MSDLETLLAEQLARRVEVLVRERMGADGDPLHGKAALSIDDTARALSIDAETVRRYIRDDRLTAVQPVPGGRVLVPVWSIRRLLSEETSHGTTQSPETRHPPPAR